MRENAAIAKGLNVIKGDMVHKAVAESHGPRDQVTVSIPDIVVMPGTSPLPLTFEARFYPIAYKAFGVNNYQILTRYQSWDASLEVREGKWNSPRVPTVRTGQTTLVIDDQWAEEVNLNEWHVLRITMDKTFVEDLREMGWTDQDIFDASFHGTSMIGMSKLFKAFGK